MAHIITVPALGGVSNLEVVELLVQPQQHVSKDQPVAVLESDKSSLEIVADKEGVVAKWLVNLGDSVGPGAALLALEQEQNQENPPLPEAPALVPQEPPQPQPVVTTATGDYYASPAVRQMARHLEINLASVQASGERGRITIEDLKRHIHQEKRTTQQAPDPQTLPDASFWGHVLPQPLSKIKKITGARLLQQWQTIPHVTQFNEAVINDLQSFRMAHKDQLAAEGVKLTLLPFIIQSLCRSLKAFKEFNAVLSSDGQTLLQLSEINIGIAVETEQGLVVPVLHQAPGKSLKEIARLIQQLAEKARKKQLAPTDLQGHTFTISSLGAYGGTAFTPIIHAPNVAIIGVSRSQKRYGPGGAAHEVLPLSLSYDHRVIDGAAGAQFLQHLVEGLEDLRLLCLG